MKLITFILFVVLIFSVQAQQINYSYGQTTAGAWYNEQGKQDADSSTTISIVFDLQDYYFEHKRQQVEAMKHVLPVIEQVSKEYGKLSGREYSLIEEYRIDDAERAIILMGSSVGTAKDTVDDLRKQGEKVGLIKIRVYRPFPYDIILYYHGCMWWVSLPFQPFFAPPCKNFGFNTE